MSKIEKLLDVHIAEYEALRREIEVRTNSQVQLISYSVAIIAAVITLLSIAVDTVTTQYPVVLLIASTLLSTLIWATLHEISYILEIYNYINQVLKKNIKNTLGLKGKVPEYLGWEKFAYAQSFRRFSRGVLSLGITAISAIYKPYFPGNVLPNSRSICSRSAAI
ncbi:MAG TPA: hypothetical protein PLC52_00420 [Anaerolineales bacterium]|nr:hypothetical protein [Anaerolineales bacterium]HRQ91317.1 hypothetical protein [Anaerolineales bacterium]